MAGETKGLFGGGASGDEAKAKAEDFVNRYSTGDPHEGYTEEEAVEYFKEASSAATPEQINAAIQQSLDSLPETDRAEFNKMLQDRQAGTGTIDIERSGERVPTEQGGAGTPATSAASAESGGIGDMLGGLLGGLTGGSSGASGSSGGGDGGIDDMISGFIGSPAGKAVLAGAAAVIMKNVLGGKG